MIDEKHPPSDAGDAAGLPPPLVRYRMLHCNDIGEDYMNACYIRAEAEVGSEGVVERAGRENWYRCADVDTVLVIAQLELTALRARVRALAAERDNLKIELTRIGKASCDKCQRVWPTEFIAIEVKDGGPTDDPAGFMWCYKCHIDGVLAALHTSQAAGEAERAALLQRLLDTRDVIDRHVPRGVLEPLLQEFDRLWADLLAAGRSARPVPSKPPEA